MDILNWLYLAKNKFVRTSIDNPKDLMIFGAKVGANKRGDIYQNYAMEINDFAATLPAGPTGPQGVAGNDGPAGPVGPVGPAGLNWQGAWNGFATYVIDDAVGYAGASWFCINNVTSSVPPSVDTANWALLAAQGANGAPGATGLQGSTGPAGPSNVLSIGTVTTLAAGSSATATITGSSPIQTLNLGIPQGIPGGAGSALVYVARVYQVGSAAPTLTVKENTTAGTWTIAQFNPGQFYLFNASYVGLPNHRIVVFATKGNDGNGGSPSAGYVSAAFDGSQIWLNVYNSSGALTNGIMGLTGMNLEIRVYPS